MTEGVPAQEERRLSPQAHRAGYIEEADARLNKQEALEVGARLRGKR